MGRQSMSEEQFSSISLAVCLTILMVFMGFIIWDLGKKSGAGRFGTAVLFMVLGVGVVGFVIKDLMIEFMTLR
jgi:hypothetical protein